MLTSWWKQKHRKKKKKRVWLFFYSLQKCRQTRENICKILSKLPPFYSALSRHFHSYYYWQKTWDQTLYSSVSANLIHKRIRIWQGFEFMTVFTLPETFNIFALHNNLNKKTRNYLLKKTFVVLWKSLQRFGSTIVQYIESIQCFFSFFMQRKCNWWFKFYVTRSSHLVYEASSWNRYTIILDE